MLSSLFFVICAALADLRVGLTVVATVSGVRCCPQCCFFALIDVMNHCGNTTDAVGRRAQEQGKNTSLPQSTAELLYDCPGSDRSVGPAQ
jgi:hypothetical protein